MSSCFQILLVPLCGPEGELETGVSSGSFKETVFRVRFPFLLLHGNFVEDMLVEGASSSSRDSEELSPSSSSQTG